MKTNIYSLRMSNDVRKDLEREARRRKVKVSQVIHTALREWLAQNQRDFTDDQEQKRLHAIAERMIGVSRGKDPNRSVNASKYMRESLGRRYGR
jgi:Arc/MetJ-type ribon-helix-helix transcriptional regulator